MGQRPLGVPQDTPPIRSVVSIAPGCKQPPSGAGPQVSVLGFRVHAGALKESAVLVHRFAALNLVWFEAAPLVSSTQAGSPVLALVTR